jgi:hypothetical protein
VTATEIVNDLRKEVTVALKIDSVTVISPDNIANGLKVQREMTVSLKLVSVRLTSPINIANGLVFKRGYFCAQNRVSKSDFY